MASEYVPCTALARVDSAEPARLLADARARLEAMGGVDTGPLAVSASVTLGPRVWLRVAAPEGVLLFDQSAGVALGGTSLAAMEQALVLAGAGTARPLASVTGRLWAVGDWQVGAGLLSGSRGAPHALLLVLTNTAHRARSLAPPAAFRALAERVLGGLAGCQFAMHDVTPPTPTADTVSAQYSRAHLTVSWVTMLQNEVCVAHVCAFISLALFV